MSSRSTPQTQSRTSTPSGSSSNKPRGSNGADTPNAAAKALLAKQLREFQRHPVEGFSAGLVDDSDMFKWHVTIFGGLNDTLYEGGILKAELHFPHDFPLNPPKMVFITEMWHPNIYAKDERKGELCISILHPPGNDQFGYEDAGERWLPVHTIESILISVISLLSADRPDLNSPANVDAAVQVRDEWDAYKKKVKRLVRRSAEEAWD